MVEDFLAKISAKTFFGTIGALIAVAIVGTIATCVLMVLLNFNILQWIE